MKKLLIRTDSSSKIGLGHVMRDLVLASQFPNADITFASQNLQGNINKEILKSGYKLEIVNSNTKTELIRLIQELHIDLLIIDHYEITYEIEKYIKETTNIKIFVLDDTYKKHHCDILLNHNIGASKKKYKSLVPKTCVLQCGAKYTLLRDEFYKEKKKKKKISQIQTIFIAMGGADSADLNLKILEVLSGFQNIKVHLITSSANENLEKLQTYIQNRNWVKLHINSKKIAKLMRKSNFGIITPSVTANEAYFMDLPFIAIKTASNQNNVYEYLQTNNFPVLEKFTSKKLQIHVTSLIENTHLINYTELPKKEVKVILAWRNDPSIKRWMHNNDDISLANHLLFIELLRESKNLYFVVKKYNRYIGTINFTNIHNKEAVLGLFSNPKLYGVGNILLDTICHYGFNTLELNKLVAEVYTDNTKALHLYKKFHFKEFAKKTINNKEVICMELIQ